MNSKNIKKYNKRIKRNKFVINKPDIDDLGEILCDYCHMTDYGSYTINTNPNNFCESVACDTAYDIWSDAYYGNEGDI